jgi:geranylgeranylglycerol-phosphate geranylgeranyltransferase
LWIVQRLIDWLRLIRLFNCLLASVGVWIGAYLTWLTPEFYGPTVVSVAAFLTCAAGNIINDLVDIRVDAINRPQRVMVSGQISPRSARFAAIALNIIVVILGIAVSWSVFVLGLVTIALLIAYNLRLKRLPVIGNVAVALSAGLTFIAGGIAVDPAFAFNLPGPLVGAIFAFLFHLVREIIKDVQDMEGDRAAGLGSLPLSIGSKRALLVALLLFTVLVILTFVPAWGHWFGPIYSIITVYFVDLPLLTLLIFTWQHSRPRMLEITSQALKVGMALGLIALLLG